MFKLTVLKILLKKSYALHWLAVAIQKSASTGLSWAQHILGHDNDDMCKKYSSIVFKVG